jgi:hypothetical protein
VVYGDEIEYVDFEYNARVGKVKLTQSLEYCKCAPPSNFTCDSAIGFLASSLSTPASYLENIIKLYWNTEPVDPLLDYYEIVWRGMASQQVCYVGTQTTL